MLLFMLIRRRRSPPINSAQARKTANAKVNKISDLDAIYWLYGIAFAARVNMPIAIELKQHTVQYTSKWNICKKKATPAPL